MFNLLPHPMSFKNPNIILEPKRLRSKVVLIRRRFFFEVKKHFFGFSHFTCCIKFNFLLIILYLLNVLALNAKKFKGFKIKPPFYLFFIIKGKHFQMIKKLILGFNGEIPSFYIIQRFSIGLRFED